MEVSFSELIRLIVKNVLKQSCKLLIKFLPNDCSRIKKMEFLSFCRELRSFFP